MNTATITDTQLMDTDTEMFEILDEEFELDELKDIATHGCAAGVHGFIYTIEILRAYDKYEDEILAALDEFANDLGEGSALKLCMNSVERRGMDPTMNNIKETAVWTYVEMTAYNLCIDNNHPDFV